ncbi:MAG TPA: xanthine dehydrogenase family protein subunit M [Gemmatimonadales bacterium]|nr:xanthine dehydrogenase family protein subunit M [Gemmatimonadales bacterium]
MISTSFDYMRATSLREALGILAQGGGTKVIAGGHSLLPVMKFRLAQPARLLDIAGLDELRGVEEYRKGARIGATTTYRDLLESDLLRERFPIITECTEDIGDWQVRNRGTIGGSLAHADPASDMPSVMLALDATFNVRSKRGRRAIKAREFFQSPFVTALAEDELLLDILLPPLPKGAGTAYLSQAQAASGYALAGAATVVARTRKTVSHAVIALTGVGEISQLVAAADQLVGTKAEPDVLQRVAAASVDGIEIQGDIHAPAPYRKHLAQVIVRRALDRALERAK